MQYRNFKGKTLPLLGFGAMRLPTAADGSIDQAQLDEMVDYAMSHGVNYFDTAYPYHGGMSEIAIAKSLSRYPRESYYLATKYPGHQVNDTYDPAEVFEHQLKKCGTDYFDFYLMHNIYENSLSVYLDERWGILDYFREQKRLGRIRHLGFSTHCQAETLPEILNKIPDMEFCQIQLNWIDETLQNAAAKVRLLNDRGIPIWVMEPLRGGKLAKLDDVAEAKLKALRPDESIPAWSFRYLEDIDGVTVVLSGMSSLEQLKSNIATFEKSAPLNAVEKSALYEIAESIKKSVPCTACRYCTDGCQMKLDIPLLIRTYNDMSVTPTFNVSMLLEYMPQEKQPSACISCGRCKDICPQGIDIPEVLKKLDVALKNTPKLSDISRERAEAAKRLRDM